LSRQRVTPRRLGSTYLVPLPRSRTLSFGAALTTTSEVVSAEISTRTLPRARDNEVPG
jgi:hypothetical protein